MARDTVHGCTQCGFQSPQWHGQCPGCGAWNSLVEETLAPVRGGAGGGTRGARARGGRARSGADDAPALRPRALAEVGSSTPERLATGIGELDRVLGGGLVRGSLVLLGGSPGIGKSTLTNMILGHLEDCGRRTLYVS